MNSVHLVTRENYRVEKRIENRPSASSAQPKASPHAQAAGLPPSQPCRARSARAHASCRSPVARAPACRASAPSACLPRARLPRTRLLPARPARALRSQLRALHDQHLRPAPMPPVTIQQVYCDTISLSHQAILATIQTLYRDIAFSPCCNTPSHLLQYTFTSHNTILPALLHTQRPCHDTILHLYRDTVLAVAKTFTASFFFFRFSLFYLLFFSAVGKLQKIYIYILIFFSSFFIIPK